MVYYSGCLIIINEENITIRFLIKRWVIPFDKIIKIQYKKSLVGIEYENASGKTYIELLLHNTGKIKKVLDSINDGQRGQ